MTRECFKEMLKNAPVLLDGATGSNLMRAGKPRGVCSETWILENPDVLLQLQKAYIDAGSQIICAPTFTTSEVYLSQYGMQDRLEELTTRLVSLSKQAAGEKAYVSGDIATMGKADIPYEKMLESYARQAKALSDAGVDLFMVETMMGLEETMAALEACKMTSDIPVFCSFSVTSDGMLYFGGSIYDAAPQIEEFGADAVGINCSCGPDQMETVVRGLANVLTVPVIAKPNAGMPAIDDQGNAVYSMAPAEFGMCMKKLYDAGASILGGCCGTDPMYIRQIKKELK